MLARIQQFIALGLMILAAAWLTAAAAAGSIRWALLGAVLLSCSHAAILAIEFTLCRWVTRRAGEDVPGRLASLRAWWHESLAAPTIFLWRQPFRSGRWPDSAVAINSDRRGVVLVHGFVCNRGLWNPWFSRLRDAKVPHVAVNLEPVFGSIDEYLPTVEAAVRRLEITTGRPPIVVAHSMGGLAVRRWWRETGNAMRIHHLVTLGTPHHGTWLARFAFVANARQMKPASPWLTDLAEQEPPDIGARMTCFYSRCDNIVFPPSHAMFAGADNIDLPGIAHVEMVDRPEPLERAIQLAAYS